MAAESRTVSSETGPNAPAAITGRPIDSVGGGRGTGDGGRGGGGVPPPPVVPDPDFGIQPLFCLDVMGSPISRDLLKSSFEGALRVVETVLARQGISLFPDPEFDGKCFGLLEKDGVWGSGFGDSTAEQRSLILQTFNILEGRPAQIGFVATTSLIQRAARAIERHLDTVIPSSSAVVERVDINLIARNQVRTVVTLSVTAAPFPLNLWPPTVRITVTETVSVVNGTPSVSSNVSSPDVDVDVPILLRGLLDLAVLPLVVFDSIPIPTGIPLFGEAYLQYIEYLVRVNLEKAHPAVPGSSICSMACRAPAICGERGGALGG
jgi:hypothetical protein